MFDCMGCGKPNCYHHEKYCNDCICRTTRTVVISSSDYLGAPRLAELLNPGESIFSTWHDSIEDEYHITIRREMN